jgi:hypothetical protein
VLVHYFFSFRQRTLHSPVLSVIPDYSLSSHKPFIQKRWDLQAFGLPDLHRPQEAGHAVFEPRAHYDALLRDAEEIGPMITGNYFWSFSSAAFIGFQ